MSDDIVENLKQPSQWLRIAFMLALAIALYVASVVLTLLTLAQAVFSLLTGSDNQNLRALGRDLATYVKQILDFLTYNSELKPFPFSDYPGANDDAEAAEVVESEVESEVEPEVEPVAKPVRKPRKPAAKKASTTKKKASAAKSDAAPKNSADLKGDPEGADKPQE